MKIAKALILAGFTTLLIIATIDLAMQPKTIQSEPPQIELPRFVKFEKSVAIEPMPIEKPLSEKIQVTIEAEQVESPEITTIWDVPISANIQHQIVKLCVERHISPDVIISMIYHESSYNEKAIGDNGKAFGLMQIQPRWHEERIHRLGVIDLLDGSQNVIVGIDYLDELLDRYNGDYGAALTAYNQGHYYGTVSRYAINILEDARCLDMK